MQLQSISLRGPVATPPPRHSQRCCAMRPQQGADQGLSLLTWTNALVPQGLLVSGVKEGWKTAWQTMVRELAPQSRDGAYKRPSYSFTGRIGDSQFPVRPQLVHTLRAAPILTNP
jgi:putative glutathione S-transferase